MRVFETLRQWARRIKRDGITLWFATRHPGTPWTIKLLGLFVVAYALSPIDLIPDFIPILGYLDDVLLLPGLIWLGVCLLPLCTAPSYEQFGRGKGWGSLGSWAFLSFAVPRCWT